MMILRYLSDGLDLFSKKSMCAQIVFCVERSGKFFGFDGFTAAGGVNKFAVADVEADMGIFVCAAGIEEDKIAGFQFAVGNFSAGCGHIACGAWQIDVEGVFYRRIGSCRYSQSLWLWCCLPICRAYRSGLGCEASIPANLGCGRYGKCGQVGLFWRLFAACGIYACQWCRRRPTISRWYKQIGFCR